MQVEQEPGLMAIGYPLRPDSEGCVRIRSADPQDSLDIDPGYLISEHDRATSIAVFRCLRRLMSTHPLARWIEEETMPGDRVDSDQEILHAVLTEGGSGYHSVGTAAMGPGAADVLDPSLKVRGVSGLRVIDASALPLLVSGNLAGPVMALASRGADLIRSSA